MSTYEELKKANGAPGYGRTPRTLKFAPEVARQRRAEQQRRSSLAQGRARAILALKYPDDYRDLYAAMKAEIDAERGPLPGDDQ